MNPTAKKQDMMIAAVLRAPVKPPKPRTFNKRKPSISRRVPKEG